MFRMFRLMVVLKHHDLAPYPYMGWGGVKDYFIRMPIGLPAVLDYRSPYFAFAFVTSEPVQTADI